MHKILTFLKDAISVAFKKVIDFIKSITKNAPAIGMMTLAACGTTGLISLLPIEVMFVSTWWISETMVVPIVSILIVYSLAWLAGRMYNETIH